MDETVTERDIELVLITGAGASRAFGVNKPMPLMGDWVADLVKRLAELGIGHVQASGLSADMDAERFEGQLGTFLRSVQAFDQIKPLLVPITQFAGSPSMFMNPDVLEQWHNTASFQLAQIVGVIHKSLYALFADAPIDERAAQRAYTALFGELGLSPTAGVVYATTNYDTIGENTLAALGAIPDVGDIQTSPFNSNERSINVDGLLGGMPRFLPILHLHGRVGWFRRDAGAYSIPLVHAYSADFGIPIVMLPDLKKDYATDPVISTIWQQFIVALRRARRVLVLGHSLHDEALITALLEHVMPRERLAVSVLAPENPSQPASGDAGSVASRVQEVFPGAAVIPLRFNSSFGTTPTDLRRWSEQAGGY